jgi:type I restriction enzyme, S subunit
MITKVALKTIAKPVTRSVDVLPSASYRTIGVKWWGEGAYERETIDGLQTAAKTLSIVKENDLIINKIWVRHGSIAIVGKNVDGCAASGEFPTFEIDGTQALPRWLHWYTKTKEFWDKCSELSQGTSGTNRIKPDLFLTVEIPLPPIEEQCRIVGRIEELAGKIAEAWGLRDRSIRECGLIIGQFQKQYFADGKNFIQIGDIATIIDPNPSHRYPLYVNEGIPIISTVYFIGEDIISTKNTKLVPYSFYENTIGKFGIQEGDIVFSRKGKIGYARPYPANLKLAMTHTLCIIQPDRHKVLPKYLLHYTRSPIFIQYLTDTMNPNSGVPTLGLGIIRSTPFPLPSLTEQHRIVEYLDELQAKVDNMKRLRQESLKELDALLPAILDKAFKGEL